MPDRTDLVSRLKAFRTNSRPAEFELRRALSEAIDTLDLDADAAETASLLRARLEAVCDQVGKLSDRFADVAAIVPRKPADGRDYTDAFKVGAFDRLRSLVYGCQAADAESTP